MRQSIKMKAGFRPDADFMELVDQVLNEMDLLDPEPTQGEI